MAYQTCQTYTKQQRKKYRHLLAKEAELAVLRNALSQCRFHWTIQTPSREWEL